MTPEALADEVVVAFKAAIAPLLTRIAALESKAREFDALKADLAARPPLRQAKTWRPGETFAVGDTCQFDGSIWQVLEPFVANGSLDHDKVKLLVKRGRDGKDAR